MSNTALENKKITANNIVQIQIRGDIKVVINLCDIRKHLQIKLKNFYFYVVPSSEETSLNHLLVSIQIQIFK